MTRREPVGTRGAVLYISPLKALGVDVQRNLRSPLAGVRAVASATALTFASRRLVSDRETRRLASDSGCNRDPPDILITTPESLYLMLTSRARTMLEQVETVIIDEIHSLAATKRGAHLFLSLERLEALRGEALRGGAGEQRELQRIGLSATQRPLEEVARLLGGGVWRGEGPTRALQPRPVTIIEAGRTRPLDLRIEVPVDDMTQLGRVSVAEGPAAAGPSVPSIWSAIQPRLVELIRAHRSTMIFVNSRRLAERLATAINELAEQEIALAHHGSIAKAIHGCKSKIG